MWIGHKLHEPEAVCVLFSCGDLALADPQNMQACSHSHFPHLCRLKCLWEERFSEEVTALVWFCFCFCFVTPSMILSSSYLVERVSNFCTPESSGSESISFANETWNSVYCFKSPNSVPQDGEQLNYKGISQHVEGLWVHSPPFLALHSTSLSQVTLQPSLQWPVTCPS